MAVADLGEHGWLVADRRPDSKTFYIKQGREVKAIIGAPDKPVLHHIAGGKLYFTSWGGGDTPFMDFPVMLIYDLKAGNLETRELFFDLTQRVAFGSPARTPGNVLSRIEFTAYGLDVVFATAPDAGPGAYAGPGLTIPWTEVSYEPGWLVLQFQATTVAQGLDPPPPPSDSLIKNLCVSRDDPLGVARLALRVSPYTVYRASCGTGERKRMLSLYLRAHFQVRFGGARED